ncbi:MAG: bifunctional UDP-N-acetylglucosamine diphosphorylase/glucosamine-1-phosphate N-acetyltransferase GlmU [Candidatus Acidiferrales bacterium]
MPSELATVILAAGKGTRLKSDHAKVLHQAAGLPLVAHVLRAAALHGRGKAAAPAWVVVGHQADLVKHVVEGFGARAVLQRPQLGTGHAVAQALPVLPRSVRRLLVLPGDAPLIRAETLRALLEQHRQGGFAATILSARLEDPLGYGRIVRSESGSVEGIVEQKSLGPGQFELREVNSGMYCFERSALEAVLGRLGRDNPHREYYLTDAIALIRGQGGAVGACLAPDPDEILGVNTRAELARVDALLSRRKAEALMAAGVTLYRPETLAIDSDVSINPDTVIERGVELRGATRIGRRCRIGAFSILENAVLGDDVIIRPHTLVFNSRVADGASVGPFAHLRDAANIRRRARIGNYVEVKKSVVGEGTKAQHLTYLGDATVGRDTNIGAGTITCNYDGVNKNPTAIGDRVFIGSGTELVAPVRVGSGGYVAAGSTVTENVPRDALAIARSRQLNKPGWARTRRQKLAAAKARKEEPPVGVQLSNARQRPARSAKTRAARKRRR